MASNWDRERGEGHTRPGYLHAVLAPIARDVDAAVSDAKTQALRLVAEMRVQGSL
ncbi:hypothetical protein ABIA33_004936 [Streptacidiphilus sp. MAP12-16]|uniref:hypothetical protein n=1 Tax=Streptacidiphilus sp. MAP12-16 TaxID=3156300 RepID=UPI003519AF27